ncbi:TonB-dependent receptor [Dyella silvatica]|uniref:TonB-dependent receptor n=1 Tax=Dyella silvatica TaxID=2992128 RepID=UPI002253F5EC|nr:TonB-dependent receptor [Dyella silvatica]
MSPAPCKSPFFTPDGDHGDIPGKTHWNLRSEYVFGSQLANLKLAEGVKNLFDRRYFTRSVDNNHGLYVSEPRMYFVQASAAI